jgi:hypothetical protein
MLKVGILMILVAGAIHAFRRYRSRTEAKELTGEGEEVRRRVIVHAESVKRLLVETVSPQLEEELELQFDVKKEGRLWRATVFILKTGPVHDISRYFEHEFWEFARSNENETVYVDIIVKEEGSHGKPSARSEPRFSSV